MVWLVRYVYTNPEILRGYAERIPGHPIRLAYGHETAENGFSVWKQEPQPEDVSSLKSRPCCNGKHHENSIDRSK